MKKKSTISDTMKKRCGWRRRSHNVQNGDTPTMMQNGSLQWRHHWNNGTIDTYTRFSMPHNMIPPWKHPDDAKGKPWQEGCEMEAFRERSLEQQSSPFVFNLFFFKNYNFRI